jgi:hypothetical protein
MNAVYTQVLYGYAPQEPRPAGLLQFNQQLSDLTSVMYRRLSTTVEVLNICEYLTMLTLAYISCLYRST